MSLAPERSARGFGVALTAVTVALTLTTAYIHLSLGGVLFTLNAIGYAALAVAFAVGAIPHPLIARFSWLPRVGLAPSSASRPMRSIPSCAASTRIRLCPMHARKHPASLPMDWRAAACRMLIAGILPRWLLLDPESPRRTLKGGSMI